MSTVLNINTENKPLCTEPIDKSTRYSIVILETNNYCVLLNAYLYGINSKHKKVKLTSSEKAVLFALASFGKKDGIYPSEEYIRDMAGLKSESSVSRAIKKLEKLGFIEIIYSDNVKGHNQYILLNYDELKARYGYVFVSKTVFKPETDLKYSEKVVYCGLCSLSGKSDIFSKPLKEILNFLQIQKNTFYAIRDSLCAKGLIILGQDGCKVIYRVVGKKTVPNKNINKEKNITKNNKQDSKNFEADLANKKLENECKKVTIKLDEKDEKTDLKTVESSLNKHANNGLNTKLEEKQENICEDTILKKAFSKKRSQKSVAIIKSFTNKSFIIIDNNNLDKKNENNGEDLSTNISTNISTGKERILKIIDSINLSQNENNKDIFNKTVKYLKNMITKIRTLNLKDKKINSIQIYNRLKNKSKDFFSKLINGVTENIKAIKFEKEKKGESGIKNEKAYYYSTIWNAINDLEEKVESIKIIKESGDYKAIPTFEVFLKETENKKIPELSFELNEFYNKTNRVTNTPEFQTLVAKAYIKMYFNDFVNFTNDLKDFYYFSLNAEYGNIERMTNFITLKCGDPGYIQPLTQGFADLSDDSKKIYNLVRYNIAPISDELSYMEREILSNLLDNYDMSYASLDAFETIFSEETLSQKYIEFLKEIYSPDVDLRLVRDLNIFNLFLDSYISSTGRKYRELQENQYEIINQETSLYLEDEIQEDYEGEEQSEIEDLNEDQEENETQEENKAKEESEIVIQNEAEEENIILENHSIPEKNAYEKETDLEFVFYEKLNAKIPSGMTLDEFLEHVGADIDDISRENYFFVSDAIFLYDANLKSKENIYLEFDRYIENLIKKLEKNSISKPKVNNSEILKVCQNEVQEESETQKENKAQEENKITGKTKIIKNLTYDMVDFILKGAVSNYFKNIGVTESEFIANNNLKLSNIGLNPIDFANNFNNQDKFEHVGVYVKLYVENYILELINKKNLGDNYYSIPHSFIAKMLENELNEQLDYKRLTLSKFIDNKESIVDINAFIESFENQDETTKLDAYAKLYAKNAVIELSEKNNIGFFKKLFTKFKNNVSLPPTLEF